MANLIKQKFLEGIDSSKFKIEQGGAIKAVNSSGQLVEVFKFDAVNEVVKVFGDEEVAVSSYVDSLMAQEVTARNAAINDAITALINGAPEALDTLKELADSLANDPNAVNSLITQITQEVTNRENAVSAESQRAQGEENLLKSRMTTAEGDIDNLEVRMTDAEQDILDEVSRAQGEENLLKSRMTTAEGDIDNLEVRMTDAEQDILDETSRAQGEENLLKSRMTTAEGDIDNLEVRMTDAEQDILDEVSRAQGEENLLKSRMTQAESDIDQEILDREAAVSAEESARQLADQNLQSQIDTEKGRVDAILLAADADKDSFAEIVTLINSIDASNDESLAGHLVDAEDAHDASAISFVNTASGMVATDVQAALDELQSQHDDLDGYAQEVRSDLDQEISNRIADVDAEETRALAAEQVLQDAISAEATARAADVDAEETRAMAAEQALQDAIDAEAQARSDEDATMLKLDGSRSMTGFLKFDLTGQNLDLANSHSEISSSGIEYVRVGLTESDVSNNVTLHRENGFTNFITVPDSQIDNGDGTFTTTYDGYFKRAKLSYNDGFELKRTSKSYDGQYDIIDESTISTGSLLLKNNSVNSDGTGIGDDINTISISALDGIAISNSVGNRTLNLGYFGGTDAYVDSGDHKLVFSGNGINLNGYNGNMFLTANMIEFGSLAKTMNPVILYAEGSYDEDNNYLGDIPAVPTDAMHAVNKAYVDSQISGNKTFSKETFEIDTSSELSYVTLAHTAVANSMVVFVNRLALHENVDYSLDVVSLYDGDVTRITWIGDFAVGGVEEIESGDVVHVVYMR